MNTYHIRFDTIGVVSHSGGLSAGRPSKTTRVVEAESYEDAVEKIKREYGNPINYQERGQHVEVSNFSEIPIIK